MTFCLAGSNQRRHPERSQRGSSTTSHKSNTEPSAPRLAEDRIGPARKGSAVEVPTVKSCGVLVTRGRPICEFLLMQHRHRWDLPKGHIDPGETEIECALREMSEETGIPENAVMLDPEFRFVHHYPVRTDRVAGGVAQKTLIVFLAELVRDVAIKTTEHPSYAWFRWNPPHRIQAQTINPLLAAVEEFQRTRVG